jgi:glutamine synthetase
LVKVSLLTDDLAEGIKAIEAALDCHCTDKMKEAMEKTREAADALEGIIPADLWPLPTYAEMLFLY